MFKDRYENALKKLVRKKAKGGKIEVAEPEEKESNVVDLMDALRNSLKRGGGGGAPRKSHTRRKAPRGRKKAA